MPTGDGRTFGSDALRRGFEDLASRAASEALSHLGERFRTAGRDREAEPTGAFDRAARFAHGTADGYREFKDKAGRGAASAVSRGAAAVDRMVGDKPWETMGLQGRDVEVARRVMTDVVPDVVGDRVSAMVDGLAAKAGVVGAGLALRLPLRSVAVPVLAGLAAAEAAKAVGEVRERMAGVRGEVDREHRVRDEACSGSMS